MMAVRVSVGKGRKARNGEEGPVITLLGMVYRMLRGVVALVI